MSFGERRATSPLKRGSPRKVSFDGPGASRPLRRAPDDVPAPDRQNASPDVAAFLSRLSRYTQLVIALVVTPKACRELPESRIREDGLSAVVARCRTVGWSALLHGLLAANL
jgi:hypothetical protein